MVWSDWLDNDRDTMSWEVSSFDWRRVWLVLIFLVVLLW